jgi:hypothetical protein
MIKVDNFSEDCEGCHLKSILSCPIVGSHKLHNSHMQKCPCRVCLIKSMCVEWCESYHYFKIECAKEFLNTTYRRGSK